MQQMAIVALVWIATINPDPNYVQPRSVVRDGSRLQNGGLVTAQIVNEHIVILTTWNLVQSPNRTLERGRRNIGRHRQGDNIRSTVHHAFTGGKECVPYFKKTRDYDVRVLSSSQTSYHTRCVLTEQVELRWPRVEFTTAKVANVSYLKYSFGNLS